MLTHRGVDWLSASFLGWAGVAVASAAPAHPPYTQFAPSLAIWAGTVTFFTYNIPIKALLLATSPPTPRKVLYWWHWGILGMPAGWEHP